MRIRTAARGPAEGFLADPRMRAFLTRWPLVLRGDNEHEVLIFRRILEMAMAQGRWAGHMGPSS